MNRCLISLALALTGLVPNISLARSAGEQCDRLFRTIARAAPPQGRYGDQLTKTQELLSDLQEGLALDTRAAKHANSGRTGFQQEQPPATFVETFDGHELRYALGSADQRAASTSPKEYRALEQRLAAMLKVLETQSDKAVSKIGVSLFHLNDPASILELLTRTSEKLRDRREMEKRLEGRAFVCILGGVLAGVLHGGVNFFNDPNEEIDEQLLQRARETAVHTEAKHFELIDIALSGHAYKDDIIAKHKRRLAQMRSLGVAVEFGARPHAYDSLVGWDTPDLSNKLELLANRTHTLTHKNLKEEVKVVGRYGYLDSDQKSAYAFTERELLTHAEKSWTDFQQLALAVGRIVAEPIALGGLGALACGEMGGKLVSRIRQRSPAAIVPRAQNVAPGLEEVLKRVRSATAHDFKTLSGSPWEYLWLGANTRDGEHSDVVLKVNRTLSPPAMELSGLSYRLPTDYLKPMTTGEETAKRIADTAPVSLRELRDELVAHQFANYFGPDLKPVDELFEFARNLKLTGEQQQLFRQEIRAVKTLSDIPGVNQFLRDLADAQINGTAGR